MEATDKAKQTTLDELQQLVDEWIRTYGVRYFDPLTCIANQCGINLQEALEKNLQKKTNRDATRHLNNSKLTAHPIDTIE